MRLRYDPKSSGKGNNRGNAVDPERCAASVWRTWFAVQCNSKRSPESKDGEWCMRHCPNAMRAKQAAKLAKWEAERAERDAAAIRKARRPYEQAVAAFDAWAESGDKYSLRDALVALADAAEKDVKRWTR